MSKRRNTATKSKRAIARDDARAFEAFMAQHNAQRAEQEAEQEREAQLDDEAFAATYLEKLEAALGMGK